MDSRPFPVSSARHRRSGPGPALSCGSSMRGDEEGASRLRAGSRGSHASLDACFRTGEPMRSPRGAQGLIPRWPRTRRINRGPALTIRFCHRGSGALRRHWEIEFTRSGNSRKMRCVNMRRRIGNIALLGWGMAVLKRKYFGVAFAGAPERMPRMPDSA